MAIIWGNFPAIPIDWNKIIENNFPAIPKDWSKIIENNFIFFLRIIYAKFAAFFYIIFNYFIDHLSVK